MNTKEEIEFLSSMNEENSKRIKSLKKIEKESKRNQKITPFEYSILVWVTQRHRLDVAEILWKSRKRHIVSARREFCVELRKYWITYQRIWFLIKKDHSTVHNLCKTYDEYEIEIKNKKWKI